MQDDWSDIAKALRAAARAPFPDALLPEYEPSLAQAYAIQCRLSEASALPVMVWKLGLTGAGAREAFHASEPVVGRLPASAIYSNRSEIDFIGREMFAEAELVFELGSDLAPQDRPYTRADLCFALKGIWAGIEIVRTRFETSDLTLPLLVADNGMAHGLVLGRRLANGWDDRFADLPVNLIRNDGTPVEGSTARVMADPLDALVWLANWLREHEGYLLKREQLVASGTCTGATEIFPGDIISVLFEGEEAARVTLDAREREENPNVS